MWSAIGYISCMNKTTIVVFLILYSLRLQAADLLGSISELESEWALAYYAKSDIQQRQLYPALLDKAVELGKRYPQAAEPKIWQATIMITNASVQSSITALSALEAARLLLEEAIQENPKALDGSAYITLGVLYYKLPAWPVSFGDNQMAEKLLKTSLEINPHGIDANYFYADFLLEQDREREAEEYLQKALQAPVRKQQVYADTQLQNEVKMALTNSRLKKENTGNRFMSLFANSSYVSK